MKKGKNMISVAEIDKMINEEIAKIRKVEQIKSRLAIVNEELAKLSEESIDEVSVGGVRNGEEWYEKGTPVAKFEKKGTHLKEEDPMMDLDADDSVELDEPTEGVAGTFEEKMAAIGRELDAQLSSAHSEDALDMGDSMDDMEDLEIGGDVEASEESSETSEETPSEEEKEDSDEEEGEIEMDEVSEKEEECEEKAPMNESIDRLGKKTNPLLERELERMRRLSGF